MRRFNPAVMNKPGSPVEGQAGAVVTQPPAPVAATQEGDPRYRIEEGDGASHAQRIVRELYHRYQKQLQRWRDYRNLFFFLGFVALFLAVLYTQRQANTAFKVHSTMEDVLVPDSDSMSSTDEVYSWLKTLLTNVWVDPKCGDGICESPFEFASYSRFGCRADCGKLQDVQNLTTVQIDTYWDFSHPVGSIPASDLMQQTTWNLCPVSTPFATGCYYDKDNTFDRLSSTDTQILTDMPDGNWTLVMRRDIFYKTRGAVRDYGQLNAVSYYYRIYMAALSAIAEQNTEMNLLRQAMVIGNMTLMEFITSRIQSVSATNTTDAQFQMDQFVNATCGCFNIPFNSSTDWLTSGNLLIAFNNTRGGITDYPTYRTSVCDAKFGAGVNPLPSSQEYIPANVTSNGTVVFGPVNGTYTTINTIQAVTNQTAFCSRVLTNLTEWRKYQTNTTQALLIDLRLGTGQAGGKAATRALVLGALKNYILTTAQELFDPVFTYPKGSLALTDMINARVDILQDQFVLGVYYSQNSPLAQLPLSRKNVYATDVYLPTLVGYAASRLNETRFQQVDTLTNIPVFADPSKSALKYPISMTLSDLFTAFYYATGALTLSSSTCQVQGCTTVLLPDGTTNLVLPNATLPDSNSTGFNITAWNGQGLQTAYNLVSWNGNNTMYMSCNLPARAPEYLGTCTNMTVSCVTTSNDTTPYNCTDLTSNQMISGNLSVTSYRQQCETPCDLQLDCAALCDCSAQGGCGINQVCSCWACGNLTRVASSDTQFLNIQQQAQAAGRSTAILADITGGASGRKLLQDLNATLITVLQQVGSVSTQQKTISDQMTSLQAQVQRANTLAEARANDNKLIELIQAGRQDIAAGQARVEAKLDEIIGKQNQSLATAQAATAALAAIQSLAQKQIAAQQALEKAVMTQLSAIQTATASGVITITQALALWKRARRDRAYTLKAAKLANLPCTSLPYQDNIFTLSNGNLVDTSTARERNIGLTNRVIQGLLLHQTRTNETNCTDSKFNKIQQTCTGPTTLKSFGVDPVFKLGTTLYDPDLDDVQGQQVVQYYNCSLLVNPTYNISVLNATTNAAPYCAELYNTQGLPYAFHHFPMEDKEPGFPVFMDINLDSTSAQSWETYLEEGLYLDQHTRKLTAELVTYNAPLRIFGYFYVEFYFSDGGSIKVKHRLHTVRVELYTEGNYDDQVRFAFEIILSIWIYCMMLYTFWQILMFQKNQKNFLKFFAHGWNWVDFISNGLLTACMCIWWVFVTKYAKTYDVALRRDVYVDLSPTANYLALNNKGNDLTLVWTDTANLTNLIDLLNWYFALNGINILLLIARVLRLMDFQPRLGVVTRSLWLAGPDLIHFAIVAGMVFIGYAMMAHLIFGNAILKFQTFGDSVNTCFEILLGNIDVNNDLRALGGLQSVAGALFFWSYELLVFMVLLNFLLAIIVDAFSEVKEKTHETVGIHTELYQLMRDKWRSLLGSCSSNYISDAKLGGLLKQWAGDETEDEKKQVQAEVQKLLTILNEDLDEEDLRNVLMECLKDAPNQEDANAKAQAQRSGLAKFLPQRRKLNATPHEVSQAAKYIVDRFGVPVEAEEEVLDAEGDNATGHTTHEVAAQGGALPAPAGLGPLAAGGVSVDKERDQLASALERLAEVQRELADGQRNLMTGQKQLAEQQAKLVGLMNLDGSGSGPA